MTKKGIFCLEGNWENDLKIYSSIQPLLGFLKENIDIDYIYRDCATKGELNFYLNKFYLAKYKDYPILYLAFHGESGKIILSDGEYSLDEIGTILENRCKGKIILIGSCSVMNMHGSLLKSFLRKTGALAVMGYKNDVDWLRSSTLEMMLLSTIQENVLNGSGIKAIKNKCNELSKLFKHKDKNKNIDFRLETNF